MLVKGTFRALRVQCWLRHSDTVAWHSIAFSQQHLLLSVKNGVQTPSSTSANVHSSMQGWMHCIHYVLFEKAMGLVRLGAVIAGKVLLITLQSHSRC